MHTHGYPSEPRWKTPASTTPHPHLSDELSKWLLDPSSLTKKLVQHAEGDFHVQVLKQCVQRPRLSEYRALGLAPQRWAVIREVLLYGKQQPWVYARTVIPLSSLKGPMRQLHHLGNRPLGEAIFAEPSLERKSIEIAPVLSQHVPPHTPCLKPLWGRRSLFLVRNKPLLVAEIFLDSLFNLN